MTREWLAKVYSKFRSCVKVAYVDDKPVAMLLPRQTLEAELARIETGNVATTIMVTCEYARRDVDLRLTELRHEFDDVVVENVHRHIADQYCLEVFIAQGKAERIIDLLGRIRGMRGIMQMKAIFMSLEPPPV